MDDERERLIRELETHQAELESQNAHLREAQQLLEESRARYADLYDFAPVAYCSLDEAARLVQLNLAGAALLGKERSRLVGSALTSFVPVEQRQPLRAHIAARIANEGQGADPELEIHGRVLRLSTAPFTDSQTGRRLCHAALLDITAEKRAEEALRLSLRMREDFLAIVSHDLRNPLGAIVASSELLLRQLPATERRKFGRRQLETIRRAADRMNRLLADLLDLSSMDAGQLSVELDEHTPQALTATVCEILSPLAQEKKIELRSVIAAANEIAFCDRDRMVQVLLNLIGNALKFTPEGGHVVVAVEARSGDLLWSVRDTGVGMTPEQQEHIFAPYWKADELSKKGTGLGLAIARGLVERHGGKLWVESAPGQGSCFFFTLPRQPEASTQPGLASARPASSEPQRVLRSSALAAKPSILIVDDEEDARAMLAELLRLDGYLVREAANGKEALALLEQNPADVILLDLVMPVMDGWEFLAVYKRTERLAGIPVMLISGQTNAQSTAQSLGLAGAIEKPVGIAELRQALERSAALIQ